MPDKAHQRELSKKAVKEREESFESSCRYYDYGRDKRRIEQEEGEK